MTKKLMVVRGRAIFLLLLTTFVMIVLVLLFSFYMIHQSERRITVQSAEYRLQYATSAIEQELQDLSSLAWWSSRNSGIMDFLMSGAENGGGGQAGLNTWSQLSEQYHNNKSMQYVRRLIVFNTGQDRFLQVGNSAVGVSEPVTRDNLGRIFTAGVARDSRWWPPVRDPYTAGESFILPLVVPVYNQIDGNEIGSVFLAASLDIITDKFRSYNTSGNSRYYLQSGDQYFRIESDRLVPEEFTWQTIDVAPGNVGSGSLIFSLRDQDGKRFTMIKYPARGMSYVHLFPAAGFSLLLGTSVWLFFGLGILVLLLGFLGWSVSRMTWELSNNDIIMKELEYAAYMDPLTGICTRKHFLELASVDITRALRQHQIIYAAMLDLDFFKQVNDNYDHSAGDMMLRASAEVIRQTIRSYDLLGRYGGEEFSLLITALDEEDAQKLMERIRENIEQNVINFEGHSIKITCSIGLAKFGENDTLETALRKADKALYAAKNSGRNRVVVCEAPVGN